MRSRRLIGASARSSSLLLRQGSRQVRILHGPSSLLRTYPASVSRGFGTSFVARRKTLGLGTLLTAAALAPLGYYLLQEQFAPLGAESKKSKHHDKEKKKHHHHHHHHKDKKDEEEQVEGENVEFYKYVIIGAGTCGYEALRQILALEPEARVLIVGEEPYKPYFRPPLSKELWRNTEPDVSNTLEFVSWEGQRLTVYYEDINAPNVKQIYGTKVVALAPNAKAILLADDKVVHYDKCLIATGGTPRPLPTHLLGAGNSISTYRGVDDFKKLEPLTRQGKHVTIVGGGFLGSELASALGQRGKTTGVKVSHVFPEEGSMELVLPYYLSGYVTDKLKELGVDVRPHTHITATRKEGDKVLLSLNDGSTLETDHVVVCIGIEPNVELATTANLEIDPVNGGILVNSELEARRDLFAAGDVSSYFDSTLGVRRRVEHYDHASVSGKVAGMNMVGARRQYDHLSMFWSSLPGVDYEAVGLVDPSLRTIGFWAQPGEDKDKEGGDFSSDTLRGVLYYLNKENKVVGVILWNVPHSLSLARAIIKRDKRIVHPQELKNAIPL
jgi:programmed cell death 8 (apoptosis-inducing factor)